MADRAKPGSYVRLPKNIMARKDIGAVAKLVYAAIADRIGLNGRCWPGLRRLARDTGASVNAIIRSLAALESANLICKDRQRPGVSNRYTLPSVSETDTVGVAKTNTLGTVSETDTGCIRNGYTGVSETAAEPIPINQTHEPLNPPTPLKGGVGKQSYPYDPPPEFEPKTPPCFRGDRWRSKWGRIWRQRHAAE